jgi:hypothetical protein
LEGGNGCTNDVDQADVWLLDLQTWNWTQVNVTGFIPPGTDGSKMQLVPEQNALYRFGGCSCTVNGVFDRSNLNCFLSSLYRFDLATMQWSTVTPSTPEQAALVPSPRSFHTMTYQQACDFFFRI